MGFYEWDELFVFYSWSPVGNAYFGTISITESSTTAADLSNFLFANDKMYPDLWQQEF